MMRTEFHNIFQYILQPLIIQDYYECCTIISDACVGLWGPMLQMGTMRDLAYRGTKAGVLGGGLSDGIGMNGIKWYIGFW